MSDQIDFESISDTIEMIYQIINAYAVDLSAFAENHEFTRGTPWIYSPSPEYPVACRRDEWRGEPRRSSLERRRIGYGAIPLDTPSLVEDPGLSGRWGASFPTGLGAEWDDFTVGFRCVNLVAVDFE